MPTLLRETPPPPHVASLLCVEGRVLGLEDDAVRGTHLYVNEGARLVADGRGEAAPCDGVPHAVGAVGRAR